MSGRHLINYGNCIQQPLADVISGRQLLAESDSILLIEAMQTRHIQTIVKAVLAVEELVACMRNVLLTPLTPSANSTYASDSFPSHQTVHQHSLPMTSFIPSPVAASTEPTSFNSSVRVKSVSDDDCNSLLPSMAAIDLSLKSSLVFESDPESHIDSVHSIERVKGHAYTYTIDNSECTPQAAPLNLSTRPMILQQTSPNLKKQIKHRDTSHWFKGSRSKTGHSSKGVNACTPDDIIPIFPSKRPIKCHVCSKVVRADNFKIHLRSHTGEKPYQCPICPFRSANPSSMPKHIRLHSRGRQMYVCSKCPFNTMYKSSYTVHLKTHPAL